MEAFVEVERGDRLESRHRVHGLAVTQNGDILARVGNPDLWTYFRSSAKPFQALAVLESGAAEAFDFDEREIAVICSSHAGEDFHIETVRGILKKIGLGEKNLQCGFHPPLDQAAREAFFREGRQPSPIYNNCSGKHAGMLSVCRYKGWPLDNYMEPDHPLQQEILRIVARYSGLAPGAIHTGVDGCGVPVFYLSLEHMAKMYGRFFSEDRKEAQIISQAMRNNPEMVGGTRRFDSVFMRELKGKVVCKGGSEGLEASAFLGEEPVAIVLKVEDGNERASWPGLIEFYAQMGLIAGEDLSRLDAFWHPPVKNVAGKIVGRIYANFTVARV